MEVLRFGSRRGGKNIGCCAIEVIQGFNVNPDSPAPQNPMTHGDSGTVLMQDGGPRSAGQTYRDQFINYLRVGTHDLRDFPDRVFLCSMSRTQVTSENGRKWLALLKETGFEFIRSTNNNVYNGGQAGSISHPVYIFGLFRNISASKIEDPFAPPKAWTDLPEPVLSHEEWWNSTTTNLLPITKPETSSPNAKTGFPTVAAAPVAQPSCAA